MYRQANWDVSRDYEGLEIVKDGIDFKDLQKGKNCPDEEWAESQAEFDQAWEEHCDPDWQSGSVLFILYCQELRNALLDMVSKGQIGITKGD